MSNRLGGKQGTAYLGTNAQQPPNWNFYPHDPTIYTYQNFSLGDLWLNTVTQQAFVLVSLERNTVTNEFNAIWTDFTGTAAGVVESLQAADGTVAFPVNGQIDFPNTVITANTNEFTNILTSVQANNSNNFLINLTPEVKLRSTLNDVVTVKSVTNNNTATQINVFKTKGTIAAPLPVVATTELSDINSYGFDGTNNTIGSSIKSRVPAGGVVGANCVESELVFSTSGSTAGLPPSILNERVVIGKDGLVTINTPTQAGSALTINGVNTNANFSTIIQATVTGIHEGLVINNLNGAAGSSARAAIGCVTQAAGTGGDANLTFANYGGTTPNYSIGMDNSAEQFVLSKSPTLGTTNVMTVTNNNNQVNYPLQCSFNVFHAVAQNNVTGAGLAPIITFTGVRYQVGNFFNTGTSQFVAPVNGRYMFCAQVQCDDATLFAGMTVGYIELYVNGANAALGGLCSPAAMAAASVQVTFAVNTILQLNAGDYVEVKVVVNNGPGNTVSLLPTTTTYFAGQLLS